MLPLGLESFELVVYGDHASKEGRLEDLLLNGRGRQTVAPLARQVLISEARRLHQLRKDCPRLPWADALHRVYKSFTGQTADLAQLTAILLQPRQPTRACADRAGRGRPQTMSGVSTSLRASSQPQCLFTARQSSAGVLRPVALPFAPIARPTIRPLVSALAKMVAASAFPVTSRATHSGPPSTAISAGEDITSIHHSNVRPPRTRILAPNVRRARKPICSCKRCPAVGRPFSPFR
eukprot:3735213-Prymnesium_polylepis.3